MSDGSQTFEQALYRLYSAGRISLDEALRNADSPTNLYWLINQTKEKPASGDNKNPMAASRQASTASNWICNPPMITLYGIPNCSTVKKARQWLSDNGLDYHFHDFKKQGVDAASLEQWASAVGLAKLINRQGTTWRALPDEVKAGAEQLPAALALMQANPR